ncbi:MAG TPA: outer membrane beta-barrel protein [Puia sp.]|nr:outer membrane beta-barrel protein [Puia sp.]
MNPGKITGRVKDSLSQKPIEYATITVFLKGNTKPVNGGTTNNKGFFSIENLAVEKYTLTIGFVGYKLKTISNISIGAAQTFTDLGSINLKTSAQTLAEVTVTARKPLVENHIDKLVYNVERDITSQGGVATDVLKKIPMVSVDVDGNVELQGSTSIQFLINGKPSTIFGNNLPEVLQAIPASQIKSIEVITSPGAKYDAEGTGGIINIILKESKAKGINGIVTLSAGSRLENGSANLNVRNGSFGMNASVSGNAQITSTTLNSLSRSSIDSDGNTDLLTQYGQSSLRRKSYKGQLGFDWDITKMNNLSGSASYNHYENNTNGYSNQQLTITHANPPGGMDSVINILRNVSTYFTFRSIDSYLDYKKKFRKDGQELDVSFQSSIGANNSSYDQNQLYPTNNNLFAGANAANLLNDHETIVQADYVQPLKNDAKLEIGAKSTFSRITGSSTFYGLNTSSGKYEFDSSQINDFTYKKDIYAFYSTISFKVFKTYDVKLGGRFERTVINAYFPASSNTVIPSYNFFMPAFTISKTLENNQTIKLSYSRRIQRPSYRSLNPYLDASDPTNINVGNPDLKPELVHYGEFAYTKSFGNGGSFVASIYSRYSTQDLQGYTYYYTSLKIGDSVYNNVAVNTEENVGIQNVGGLNFYGNAPITSKLTLRGSISFYDLYIKNELLPNNETNSINYRTNLNATYQYNGDLIFEFFGNFRSPSHEIQGSSTAFITYNFAFKKMIWKKNGSIGFTTTNPFNKYVDLKTRLTGQNFSLINDRRIPYRSFGISFFYKFGKLEFKKIQEEDTGDSN